MPRLTPVSDEAATPEVRALFEKDIAREGEVALGTRIAAYRPGIAAAHKAFGGAIKQSRLIDAALRCLVNVRIANIIGCEYWADRNAAGGSEAGASLEKIADLPRYKTSPHYTDAERVALEFAEGASATPLDVPDELFERLRAHYTDEQIVELTYIIACENLGSRFNFSLRVEPQGHFCFLPQAAVT
jgi:alkylhydroperoxidase family enzyme